jgi:hypothetical protein
MMKHVWEATVYASKKVALIFRALFLFYVALHDWAMRFSDVKSVSSFIVPRIAAFIVGMLITPFPLWAVLVLSFLPTPAVGMIYIFSILVVLKQ